MIVRDGSVLVCQRAGGKHLAGQWEFPGGKVEDGEDFPAALAREIEEELGCRVAVGEELAAVEHHYPELAIRLRPFICEIADGEPEAREHAAVAWVRPEQLGEVELAEADRKVAAVMDPP